jgi:hypothetical protein
MFIISQYILQKSNVCNPDNISTYAIATGLIIYASIYLYLLYYNDEFLYLFNKFIIYIIGIDLLLSTFYYFSSEKANTSEEIPELKLGDFKSDHIRVLENGKIKEHLNVSDEEDTEDFEDDYDENLDQDIDNSSTSSEIISEQQPDMDIIEEPVEVMGTITENAAEQGAIDVIEQDQKPFVVEDTEDLLETVNKNIDDELTLSNITLEKPKRKRAKRVDKQIQSI